MAAKPIRLTYPYITLTKPEVVDPPSAAVTVDLTCYARGVHLMGDEDGALATFCDPLGYAWKLTLDLLQSLGADGLDTLLWSLGGPGTLLEFEFAYIKDDVTPAVASNPHWTGTCRMTAWPIVDAGIDEPTEINLEMDIIGEVVRDPAV